MRAPHVPGLRVNPLLAAALESTAARPLAPPEAQLSANYLRGKITEVTYSNPIVALRYGLLAVTVGTFICS